MEQLHFITKLLDIKDPNIKILDIINMDTHKEIIAKLDYEAPSCPDCGSLMKNKEPEKFFGLIEDNLKQVHPIFQTVFKTFLKDKDFYRFEHQKRKDKICPFSSLAFFQPTTVDKEPKKKGRNLSFLELSFSSTHYS
ncbi:transposase [Streptococcus pneumoniae]|nr:transposase [Streptococcus pneumoniae]